MEIRIRSRSDPRRIYRVLDGRCNCAAASFALDCWHAAAAQSMLDMGLVSAGEEAALGLDITTPDVRLPA